MQNGSNTSRLSSSLLSQPKASFGPRGRRPILSSTAIGTPVVPPLSSVALTALQNKNSINNDTKTYFDQSSLGMTV